VEKNKQEFKGACFGQEQINLKQICASGATEITTSASNTERCQTAQG